jgi:hypothetical protein
MAKKPKTELMTILTNGIKKARAFLKKNIAIEESASTHDWWISNGPVLKNAIRIIYSDAKESFNTHTAPYTGLAWEDVISGTFESHVTYAMQSFDDELGIKAWDALGVEQGSFYPSIVQEVIGACRTE